MEDPSTARPDPTQLPGADDPFVQLRFGELLLWLGLGILGGFALTGGLLPALEVEKTDPIALQAITIPIYLAAGAWLLLSFRRQGIDWGRLTGPAPEPKYMRLSLGVVLTALLLGVALKALIYLRLSGTDPGPIGDEPPGLTETGYPHVLNALLIFGTVIVAPIVQEVFFRGVLIHRWAARFNPRAAVLYSSLFFGFIHFDVIGYFVFGLLMARLYLKSRSLHVPILCHMLHNAILVVSGTAIPGPASPNSLVMNRVLTDEPWIGLSALAVSFPLILFFSRELESPPEQPLPYHDPEPRD